MEIPKQQFNTDEIIDVFEHLRGRKDSWSVCMAEHGLDPEKVGRAFTSIFESGEGRIATAAQAFILGLQFGAMRLEPFPFDPDEALCRSPESGGGSER